MLTFTWDDKQVLKKVLKTARFLILKLLGADVVIDIENPQKLRRRR